jgi:antitoxin component YwqK of YwqJK toxin-antitoxin module
MKRDYAGIIIPKSLMAFFVVVLITLFLGCNSYYNTHNIYIEDGLILKEGEDIPFTGRILDTLDNKIIEYDVVNGVKNGEFVITSTEGESAIYGFIENNKNVGKWSYFFNNGELESEGYFKEDNPHGKWFWYYKGGNVKSEGYYINGVKVGRWKTYSEQGSLVNLKTYVNGELVNEVSSVKFISL